MQRWGVNCHDPCNSFQMGNIFACSFICINNSVSLDTSAWAIYVHMLKHMKGFALNQRKCNQATCEKVQPNVFSLYVVSGTLSHPPIRCFLMHLTHLDHVVLCSISWLNKIKLDTWPRKKQARLLLSPPLSFPKHCDLFMSMQNARYLYLKIGITCCRFVLFYFSSWFLVGKKYIKHTMVLALHFPHNPLQSCKSELIGSAYILTADKLLRSRQGF